MKRLNLVNTIAEYNLLKSNYDSIDPYVCYIQDEKEVMYDGVLSTWLIRYTSSDGNIITPRTNKFGDVNIVSNIYRDGEGVIVFDGEVKSIEGFDSCSTLISITIPNSVTSIGDAAFQSCSSLTSITIPDSVTSIGSLAFLGCSGLASITIPKSVTLIKEFAFVQCSGLTSIVVDRNNPIYDSRDNCNAIILTEANALLHGCENTVIPNSVTTIVDGAFDKCLGLISITIPNSVTVIWSMIFTGCINLTSIVVDSITPPLLPLLPVFGGLSSNFQIYVPDESVNAYKNTTGWSEYADKIKPLSLKSV